MATSDDIRAVDIDLDRVLWDAEYRRRVIDTLKRRHESPTADPPTDVRRTDPAAGG